jgi:hypothetical protein
LPSASISSASIPGVFPHRVYKDGVYMDGGTVWNVNLISAVSKCMELVDSKSKIVVDIVNCGQLSELGGYNSTANTIGNFNRYRAIKKHYSQFDDVIEFMNTEPNVNFRYLFYPTEPLTSGIHELFFT